MSIWQDLGKMTGLREASWSATACNFVKVMPQQQQLVMCNGDASGAFSGDASP